MVNSLKEFLKKGNDEKNNYKEYNLKILKKERNEKLIRNLIIILLISSIAFHIFYGYLSGDKEVKQSAIFIMLLFAFIWDLENKLNTIIKRLDNYDNKTRDSRFRGNDEEKP